jgi:hypothetical protein
LASRGRKNQTERRMLRATRLSDGKPGFEKTSGEAKVRLCRTGVAALGLVVFATRLEVDGFPQVNHTIYTANQRLSKRFQPPHGRGLRGSMPLAVRRATNDYYY